METGLAAPECRFADPVAESAGLLHPAQSAEKKLFVSASSGTASWPHGSGRQPKGRPVPSMPSTAGAWLSGLIPDSRLQGEVGEPAKLHHVLLFPLELRRPRQPSPAILLLRCTGSNSSISRELNWTCPLTLHETRSIPKRQNKFVSDEMSSGPRRTNHLLPCHMRNERKCQ